MAAECTGCSLSLHKLGDIFRVQRECIPQAVLGRPMDILGQANLAKSGMGKSGKTAVLVLATLQQIDLVDGQVSVLVMCHTRQLAYQIVKEYERFSKYTPTIKAGVYFRGLNIQKDKETLKSNCPHVVVGTPGCVLALVHKKVNLRNLKHFVLDECDKMFEQLEDTSIDTQHYSQLLMQDLDKILKWAESIP